MNNIFRFLFLTVFTLLSIFADAQKDIRVRKKDRKKDIEFVTTEGSIVIRLNDSTPLHRDNFIRLVRSGYYDSILFHRVINTFMIQAGDPNSRRALPGQPLGNGGPGYTIDAEFRPSLYHKKGALAAARMGDNVNPERKSSGSQFYIVQGKKFTDKEMDALEQGRLQGYKIPEAHRELYRTIGGTPQLDQQYTVFGEVVRGIEVVDRIATTATSQNVDRDRPIKDVRILKAKLVKRKKR